MLVILQWRILGGMDTSDPQAPKIVHAFMPRDSEGYSSKESWDVLGIFAWALMGFGNIYCAMAQRALDLTVETVKKKTSLGVSRSMAYHPGVQQGVAEMVLELEGVGPHLDQVAQEWVAAWTTARGGSSRS